MMELGYGLLVLNMAACAINVQLGSYGLAAFNGLVSILLMFAVTRRSV